MKRRKAQPTELDGLTAEGRDEWHQLCATLPPLLGTEMASDETRQTKAMYTWLSQVPDTLTNYLSSFYLSEVVRPMLPLVVAHPPEERADLMRKIGEMVVGVARASMDEAVRTAESAKGS